ncbi:MAG: peptidoglycan-binding protein [Actinomycetes bacterium]
MSAVILRHGDSGPGVAEVRDRLIQLGLIADHDNHTSDYFDDELESSLREFQQSRGLTVDGTVGPQTLRRLEESRWTLGDRVLSYTPGHVIHGEDVAQLQQRLLGLGFTLDRIDGVFGRITDKATRDFQLNVGLAVDGIAGPDVFRALARLSRTVAGGNQAHLRELASWDTASRGMPIDKVAILIDPSDDTRKLLHSDLTEADVCWDIANRLEGRLMAMGALAVLTRSGRNHSGDERARAALANDQKIDFVISLRCDSSTSVLAHGVSTYYFGHEFSHSATGLRLAEIVQEEICAHTDLLDCRTHAKTWDLLRMTRMPAVRIELGYVTNPHDSEKLSDQDVRDHIAAAVSAAVNRILAPRIG